MAGSNLSTRQLIGSALEMAEEIKDRHSQYYALASVIEEGLAPPEPGADSTDWHCYRLAQLLSESMEDVSQLSRLVECLKTAGEQVARSPA